MYCGNNRRNSEVKNGNLVIGNRYGCLKKGIGIGMNLPADPEYKDYAPIDTRKIYCGKAPRLPRGYQLMGSNSMCLQKGVGVGKKIKATS